MGLGLLSLLAGFVPPVPRLTMAADGSDLLPRATLLLESVEVRASTVGSRSAASLAAHAAASSGASGVCALIAGMGADLFGSSAEPSGAALVTSAKADSQGRVRAIGQQPSGMCLLCSARR